MEQKIIGIEKDSLPNGKLLTRSVSRHFCLLDSRNWEESVGYLILDRIHSAIRSKGSCDFMLTGGNSAGSLYKYLGDLPGFSSLRGVNFYFGDERCVTPRRVESNFGLANRTLFRNGVPFGCSVFPMRAEDPDRDAAAKAYEAVLPHQIDILLLSMGSDGHIASLFPHDSALEERNRGVLHVKGPPPISDRLTITPPILKRASTIIVMALGAEKARLFQRLQSASWPMKELPAVLVADAFWFLNSDVSSEMDS